MEDVQRKIDEAVKAIAEVADSSVDRVPGWLAYIGESVETELGLGWLDDLGNMIQTRMARGGW